MNEPERNTLVSLLPPRILILWLCEIVLSRIPAPCQSNVRNFEGSYVPPSQARRTDSSTYPELSFFTYSIRWSYSQFGSIEGYPQLGSIL